MSIPARQTIQRISYSIGLLSYITVISHAMDNVLPFAILCISYLIGSITMGPIFYLNNRWVYVPDPGDMFEVAMLKPPDSELKRHERQLQKWIETARNASKESL